METGKRILSRLQAQECIVSAEGGEGGETGYHPAKLGDAGRCIGGVRRGRLAGAAAALGGVREALEGGVSCQ
jgi:hypothetical protein